MLKIDSTEFITNLEISLRSIEFEFNTIDIKLNKIIHLIENEKKDNKKTILINALESIIRG